MDIIHLVCTFKYLQITKEKNSTLSGVWAFHISRLTYTFSSSVEGMEVAYSSGATVVTNHPVEFEPFLIHLPSDRGGPTKVCCNCSCNASCCKYCRKGGGSMSLDVEISADFLCLLLLHTKLGEDGQDHTVKQFHWLEQEGGKQVKTG